MSEQELFERFRQEVADQLAPLTSKISDLSDEFKKLMHPDTGMYPRIRAVEDSAKRSHYRIDVSRKEELLPLMKEVQVLRERLERTKRVTDSIKWLWGAVGTVTVTVISGVLIWFFTH